MYRQKASRSKKTYLSCPQVLLITFLSINISTNTAIAQTTNHLPQGPKSSTATSFGLDNLSIQETQHALNEQVINSQQLVNYYLQRIATLDQQGPELRAIIEVNPTATRQAVLLDQERQQGHLRSALHGIPIVLKANISTHDALATTAGSLALNGFHAHRDAALAQQLKAAGMIILGKSNLSEWSNFRGRQSSSGWSSLGGQTRNPYALNRSPCGSSSGSAVAVSADLTLLAVGTETNGSITCPAAVNGIAGIKPTHGAVSSDGIIPIASSLDIAGPMARSIADSAALLEVMLTPEARQKIGDGLHHSALRADLSGARIGVVTAFAEQHPDIQAILDHTVQNAKEAGAQVFEIPHWSFADEVYDDFYFTLVYEFKRDINRWLKDFHHPNHMKTLKDLIHFNEQHTAQIMPLFNQEYFYAAEKIQLKREKENWQQARHRSQMAAQSLIDTQLNQHQLDAILLPAYGPAWLIDHVKGDRFELGTSMAAALSGYPSATFPAGFIQSLPIGLSLIGQRWSEKRLVALASGLEKQLAARKAPQFLPSLESLHAAPSGNVDKQAHNMH